MDIFEVMEQYEGEENCRIATVLEGDSIGEKAFFTAKGMVWQSMPEGFFAKHKKEAEKQEKCGIATIAGQRLFFDNLGRTKRLVICGGGHVSIPIIELGLKMGFEVTVLEDRPSFADNARRAGATQVLCDSFENGLSQIEGSADTFFVIVTRGHRYDKVCLEKIVLKRHAYIGMIGSRKRVHLVKQELIEAGSPKEVLDEVYTPIGLDIGAETPVEIAIAIMAEIIEVKNRRQRNFGFTREILRAVRDTESYPGRKVMATIVARQGSAPREVGTKMLFLADGRTVGTIGGGCMEAEVQRQARLLLFAVATAELCHVDLTGANAEDDGMVCGGVIDVLLELV